MSAITFKRDTAFRKQFFVPGSFAHPAKMDAQLLIWIVDKYTKEGEVILDPMAGSGTTMLACTLGRDVVMVELEKKFCKMMADNWNEVRMRPQLGYSMGDCQIIQGDARQLKGMLVDKIVTSPPFAAANQRQDLDFLKKIAKDQSSKYRSGENKGHFASAEAIERYYEKQSIELSADNISNLPYGEIDKCIFSPPFAEAQSGGGIAKHGYQGNKHSPTDLVGKRSYTPENIGNSEGQIGNLPYGQIDKIVTSPPYENQGQGQGKEYHPEKMVGSETGLGRGYSESPANIGNLKSESYLQAMLQVYQQCHKVLKPDGLMILVTKNFIRNKQVVRLDTDTIKLCEQAGFTYLERHYRKLPSQSFWRVIYHQKHPEVEQILSEDVLVLQRVENLQG